MVINICILVNRGDHVFHCEITSCNSTDIPLFEIQTGRSLHVEIVYPEYKGDQDKGARNHQAFNSLISYGLDCLLACNLHIVASGNRCIISRTNLSSVALL